MTYTNTNRATGDGAVRQVISSGKNNTAINSQNLEHAQDEDVSWVSLATLARDIVNLHLRCRNRRQEVH